MILIRAAVLGAIGKIYQMSSHDTVREGYEVIAEAYHSGRVAREEVNVEWLDGLRPLMPSSGKVVDLGCGAGVPITRYFADRCYDVRGFDLSSSMLEIARREVPRASFHEIPMEDVELSEGSIDIVVSMFAIIHVPRERHANLFRKMFMWLRSGGIALLSLGADDNPNGFAENWHGAPMAWSHYDAELNREMLREAGFRIEWEEIEAFGDPHERHLFVLVRRP